MFPTFPPSQVGRMLQYTYATQLCVLRSSRLSKDSDPEGHLLHILLVHPRSPSRARVNPPDQWPLGPLLWSCWPSWDSVQKLVQAAATVLSCSLCGGVQIGTDDDLWPLLPWTETPKHSCSPPSRDTIVLSYLLGCFPPRGTHLAAVKDCTKDSYTEVPEHIFGLLLGLEGTVYREAAASPNLGTELQIHDQ